MSEVQNQETPQNEILRKRGMKSALELKEIYQTQGADALTTDELTRYRAIVDLEVLDANRINALEAAEKSTRARVDRQEKYSSRGRELRKTVLDQQRTQSQCSHKKGGRGLEALSRGGNSPDYAFIKHLLPTNEWYIRCQRCGKTFRPPHTQDFATPHFNPKTGLTTYSQLTAEQEAKFQEALTEYRWAMDAPTDNISSQGITFQHTSDDGNVTAKNFAHEVMKDVTLR